MSSSTKTKMGKVVRFNNQCKLRYFCPPTSEDVSNAWYKQSDYDLFRAHTWQLVQSMQDSLAQTSSLVCSNTDDEELLSWIGLEGFLHRPSLIRTARRTLVWDIVLKQHRGDEPHTIARYCNEISQESERAAQHLACILEHQLKPPPQNATAAPAYNITSGVEPAAATIFCRTNHQVHCRSNLLHGTKLSEHPRRRLSISTLMWSCEDHGHSTPPLPQSSPSRYR